MGKHSSKIPLIESLNKMSARKALHEMLTIGAGHRYDNNMYYFSYSQCWKIHMAVQLRRKMERKKIDIDETRKFITKGLIIFLNDEQNDENKIKPHLQSILTTTDSNELRCWYNITKPQIVNLTTRQAQESKRLEEKRLSMAKLEEYKQASKKVDEETQDDDIYKPPEVDEF